MWCCSVHPATGDVDTRDYTSHMRASVASMNKKDWVALCLSAGVSGLVAVGELKDITLCAIGMQHAQDKLSVPWRLAFLALNGARLWVFLPWLFQSLTFLALLRGGVQHDLNFSINVPQLTFLPLN